MMRLRIDFSKTDPMRFCGHLDLFRTWERTFRRAALHLSYTQGYKHHPRINIASALPLGFTSSNEIMDVWLDNDISIEDVSQSLQQTLPPGLLINQISPIDISAPSLQSILVGSEYLIVFLDHVIDLEERIEALLNQSAVQIERRGKIVDLKPLIYTITLYPNTSAGHQQLFLFLSTTQEKNGRPDEVIKALGLDASTVLIHRQKLVFQDN